MVKNDPPGTWLRGEECSYRVERQNRNSNFTRCSVNLLVTIFQPMKPNFKNDQKTHLIVIFVLFIIVNAWVLQHFGIKVMDDSHRYLRWTNEIWEGKISLYMFWYSGYVIFLSLILKLGLGLGGVVFIQITLSLIACFCLYFLTKRFTDQKWPGLIASCGYLMFFEISSWNVYILTESIFTSCIIILITWVYRLKKLKDMVLFIPFLLFVNFIRPMGITVLLSFLAFVFFEFKLGKNFTPKFKSFMIFGCIGFVLTMMILLLEGNPGIQFFYSKGKVVWGADQVPHLRQNPWLVIDASNIIYNDKQSSTLAFFQFALENPIYLLELFMKKCIMFLAHIKPYYSVRHNVFIISFLLPLYLSFSYGLLKANHTGIKAFAFTLFLLNMLMTGFTVEAWDGRFLIPTLPLLFVVASLGLDKASLGKRTSP